MGYTGCQLEFGSAASEGGRFQDIHILVISDSFLPRHGQFSYLTILWSLKVRSQKKGYQQYLFKITGKIVFFEGFQTVINWILNTFGSQAISIKGKRFSPKNYIFSISLDLTSNIKRPWRT